MGGAPAPIPLVINMPAESASKDVTMAPSASVPTEDLLDLPLSAVGSFELSDGSTSESEEDSEAAGKENSKNKGRSAEEIERRKAKKEKKQKKKDKKKKRKPRLINTKTKADYSRRRDKDVTKPPKDGMRQKVLHAVAEYIEANADTWTASVMREELCEKNGWESNAEFVTSVKTALQSLGMGSGGNTLKGA